jgi:subtilisin family serine protease
MAAIGATAAGAHAVEDGDRRVLVGIVDTGVDWTHPDLRGIVDRRLSRNFTVDIPAIDGPCSAEPDRSCRDGAGVDEDGHGTHVAGTVAAARNGLGTVGVAPGVRLVNLRAGQDSGFFFLPATVDALTYAADRGVDVVNMSFFIDPWLYNCTGRRGGTAAERLEQRTVVRATNRALDYAHARGVTLVGAAGNEGHDLSRVRVDTSSPNFPPGRSAGVGSTTPAAACRRRGIT